MPKPRFLRSILLSLCYALHQRLSIAYFLKTKDNHQNFLVFNAKIIEVLFCLIGLESD